MSRIHYDCRWDERLKPKDDESTCLEYTGDGKVYIYYESTKWNLKTKYVCECRCYKRLQTKTKEFTCLSYTELVLELEHLKIETRLITEMFENVMGECEK
jgi:hypothetical protein